MNPLSLEMNIEWMELPTDGSKCAACKEVIVGNMFQMVKFVNHEPFYTDTKVCSPCYNEE